MAEIKALVKAGVTVQGITTKEVVKSISSRAAPRAIDV
jgi:hypothetical protein